MNLRASTNISNEAAGGAVFCDSHCHFDFAEFDPDREPIWAYCNQLGVRQLIIPGVEPAQWNKAENISMLWNGVYFSVGLHPWWIEKNTAHLPKLTQELFNFAQRSNCVAIGECGLDAMIPLPLEQQQAVLDIHLNIASETQLPLIIHCRKSHNELIAQLKQYSLPAGGVVHGFSGSLELGQSYCDLGFYLGIGGTITYERANKIRNAVKQLPIECLLLETDAPDMPLFGCQGQRNSPDNIISVAEVLAELRGLSIAEVAQHTTRNARNLFKID